MMIEPASRLHGFLHDAYDNGPYVAVDGTRRRPHCHFPAIMVVDQVGIDIGVYISLHEVRDAWQRKEMNKQRAMAPQHLAKSQVY